MSGDFYRTDPVLVSLNGIRTKQPTGFRVGRFNLTKGGRLASGRMSIDLVAKKRKYFFTYGVVRDHELQAILNAIDGVTMFFPLVYRERGQEFTVQVYVGAIEYDRGRAGYWTNLQFDLIEQ